MKFKHKCRDNKRTNKTWNGRTTDSLFWFMIALLCWGGLSKHILNWRWCNILSENTSVILNLSVVDRFVSESSSLHFWLLEHFNNIRAIFHWIKIVATRLSWKVQLGNHSYDFQSAISMKIYSLVFAFEHFLNHFCTIKHDFIIIII